MCQINLAGHHCFEAEKNKEINDTIAANKLAVVITKRIIALKEGTLSVLSCTKCISPLSKEMINSDSLAACPSCNSLLRADVFPAVYRSLPRGHCGEALQISDEAGCFYHPGKKAVTPCSACGRFVCALCDVTLSGRHLCPACFEKGKSKRKIKSLEHHRTCYDTIALMVATVPILFYFITPFSAPLAIYLTVRHWNTPSGIIPRTKIRFILAFFMAGLQIAGWILFFFQSGALDMTGNK